MVTDQFEARHSVTLSARRPTSMQPRCHYLDATTDYGRLEGLCRGNNDA